jgi:hypothetical protein
MEMGPMITSTRSTQWQIAFSPVAPPIGTGLHHLRRGNGIRSKCPHLDVLRVDLPDSLDDRCADPTALTIDDRYLKQEGILPNLL